MDQIFLFHSFFDLGYLQSYHSSVEINVSEEINAKEKQFGLSYYLLTRIVEIKIAELFFELFRFFKYSCVKPNII